jgi:hypothetical protein
MKGYDFQEPNRDLIMGSQFTIKDDTAHHVNNQITLFLQGNNLIFNIF